MVSGPLPVALLGPGHRWLYCEGGTPVLGQKVKLHPPACHPASGGSFVGFTVKKMPRVLYALSKGAQQILRTYRVTQLFLS